MSSNTSTQTCGIYSLGSEVLATNVRVLCFTNVIFFTAGTLLNGLVLCTFVKSRLLRSKTSFYLVAVMSGFDFIVVTVVHPLSVVYFYSGITGNDVDCQYYKPLYNILRYLFCSVSSYILLLMNAKRFMAVCCPFYYQRFIMKPKLSWCAILVCITIIGVWLLTMKVTSTKVIVVITKINILFLATGVMYTTIYIIARKKRHHNNISQSRDAREQRRHFLQNI